MQETMTLVATGMDADGTAAVHNTPGPAWLYVEDIGGGYRWIHRNRVVEINEPLWMDMERFTLVTRLDHPSQGQALGEGGAPLRKGF